MAQVQNLLDLFRQSRPDAQASAAADAKPAPRKVTTQGTAGKSGRNQGDLLPMDAGASRGGNKGVANPASSFQTNMEKSAAKLEAKERTLKERAQKPSDTKAHGPATAESRATKAKTESSSEASAKSSAPRNDGTKRANDAREARAARAQARHAAPPKSDRDAAAKIEDQDQDNTAQDASATLRDDNGKNDQPKGLDEKSRAAIKKGLANLGIKVDDKQLQDPAFLADILRMLQAMPAQALPADDSQSAVAAVDGTDGSDGTDGTNGMTEANEIPADAGQIAAAAATLSTANKAAQAAPTGTANPETQATAQTAGPAQAASPSDTKPQIEGPKPLSRQDLARMLEDRIGGLERAAQGQANRIQVSAQAPTVTPKEWQGVQARPQAEGPSPDPMPIADLDRLRVMQASALQAAPAKTDATGPRTDLVLESDSVEPTSGPAGTAHVEAGHDSTASQDQDAQSDLFGQKGDQAGGAQMLGKESAQSVKDGSAGTQFNQVLDQARAIDHRAALAADVAPRLPVHDASVLDQIARKMTLTTHKTGDEINIQLSPEHLGKVNVSLEMKEDGMTARISVENDSVRKQVEENISVLKDALKDQGIQLQGMEVSVDQRHASLFNPDGSNAESFFRRQGRGNGQGNGGPGTENAGLDSAPESDTGRRWGYNTMEYIG
ncbi:MAG: flagellar hook-length control protein FliK [Fibrobacteres bacterium]|nr:flagellar hook-length control protein FliK [Fibrobacterota bacterium]